MALAALALVVFYLTASINFQHIEPTKEEDFELPEIILPSPMNGSYIGNDLYPVFPCLIGNTYLPRINYTDDDNGWLIDDELSPYPWGNESYGLRLDFGGMFDQILEPDYSDADYDSRMLSANDESSSIGASDNSVRRILTMSGSVPAGSKSGAPPLLPMLGSGSPLYALSGTAPVGKPAAVKKKRANPTAAGKNRLRRKRPVTTTTTTTTTQRTKLRRKITTTVKSFRKRRTTTKSSDN